jgi:CheY-like chemotaxis protein
VPKQLLDPKSVAESPRDRREEAERPADERDTDPELIKKLRIQSFELKLKLETLDAGLKSAISGKTPSRPHLAPLDEIDRTTRPRRVLIVEDEADTRDLLTRALTNVGHFVEAASNGIDGLVKLGELRPDVAIIDLGLPDLNGYALARKIRGALREHCPLLVAHTAYEGASIRAASLAAGFHIHAVKPIKLADLILLIQSTPRLGVTDKGWHR